MTRENRLSRHSLPNVADHISQLLSIVAVHGLEGDWEYTWQAENGKVWLRDFLPNGLPSARVMSYGYNSATAFSKAVTDIDDEAAMLLDRLDGERVTPAQKQTPIIFIAHSLGGIVVKNVSVLECTAATSQIKAGYDTGPFPVFDLRGASRTSQSSGFVWCSTSWSRSGLLGEFCNLAG